MKMLCRAVFTLLLGLSVRAASPGPQFTPWQQWKAAVMEGDRAALERLYSANPSARFIVGKDQAITEADEIRFWSGLKAVGATSINPKMLSFETKGDLTQVIIRVELTRPDGNLVAGGLQVWLHEGDTWRIAASQHGKFSPDPGTRLSRPATPNPPLSPAPAEARSELKSAEQRARSTHKRVLVVFGANWCYDCHVLDATLRSPSFAPLVNANYIVVHINIGDEGRDNNDLAASMGVNLDKGVPSLAVLDGSGKVIVAQRNGEFESATRIGPEDVRGFLQKWKPTA
jgi:thiol-disulfide isomerase/thioredoxin